MVHIIGPRNIFGVLLKYIINNLLHIFLISIGSIKINDQQAKRNEQRAKKCTEYQHFKELFFFLFASLKVFT